MNRLSLLKWAFAVVLLLVRVAGANAQDAGAGDAGIEPDESPSTQADEAAGDEDSEDEKEAEETAEEVVATDPAVGPGRSPASTPPAPDASKVDKTLDGEEQEEAQEEEVEEELGIEPETDAPLVWRNSIFTWGNSLSANSLTQRAGISYNPTYSMSFRVRPRFYLTDQLYLALDQSLSIELTDTDTRARNREPVLSDTLIDLIWAGAYSTDLGFAGLSVTPGLRLQAPLSITSRAQGMILGLGPSVLALAPVKDVMSGWVLGASGRWLHFFRTTNVTETENGQACRRYDSLQGQCVAYEEVSGVAWDQTGGQTVQSDRLILALFSSLSFVPNATFDVSFAWVWDFGYGLKDATVPVLSEPDGELTIGDQSDTHLRVLTSFSIGFSYTFEPWINASLSLNTFQGEFQPDGDRSNPFFDIDVTTFNLSATITLDRFYTDIIVGKDPDAGGPTNPSMRAARRQLRAF